MIPTRMPVEGLRDERLLRQELAEYVTRGEAFLDEHYGPFWPMAIAPDCFPAQFDITHACRCVLGWLRGSGQRIEHAGRDNFFGDAGYQVALNEIPQEIIDQFVTTHSGEDYYTRTEWAVMHGFTCNGGDHRWDTLQQIWIDRITIRRELCPRLVPDWEQR